jgi:hypothetical protein
MIKLNLHQYNLKGFQQRLLNNNKLAFNKNVKVWRFLSTSTPQQPQQPSQQLETKLSSGVKENSPAGGSSNLGMPWTRRMMTTLDFGRKSRRYYWIDEEAEKLIAQAYQLHLPDRPFPPSVNIDLKKLEALKELPHYEPKSVSDRVALATVKVLENFMHLFFRSKYDHHAVTLETVAAVPGFVSAMHRHMRSLRRMKRDHGWIDNLLEESTNERMHLLIWMQHTQPALIERLFVLFAQGAYVTFYSLLYVTSPKTAHRAVGYLEESAYRVSS